MESQSFEPSPEFLLADEIGKMIEGKPMEYTIKALMLCLCFGLHVSGMSLEDINEEMRHLFSMCGESIKITANLN